MVASVLVSPYHWIIGYFIGSRARERLTHTDALRPIPPLFRYVFLWPLMLADGKQAGDETDQPEHGDGGGNTRQSRPAGDNDTINSTKAPTKGEVDFTYNLPWLLLRFLGSRL